MNLKYKYLRKKICKLIHSLGGGGGAVVLTSLRRHPRAPAAGHRAAVCLWRRPYRTLLAWTYAPTSYSSRNIMNDKT